MRLIDKFILWEKENRLAEIIFNHFPIYFLIRVELFMMFYNKDAKLGNLDWANKVSSDEIGRASCRERV